MPKYRSATTTHGRNMAGARALWRATGMTDADFGKPIIAVVNSFTQFVPGHVHLRDLGKLVAEQIEARVVLLKNLIPLQLMTVLQWGTVVCSILYHRVNLLLILLSIWLMRTVLMQWCVSQTVTRSPQVC